MKISKKPKHRHT